MRKAFSHEFVVDRAVGDAFPLFTPKGEEKWVPGWKPDYFAPDSGETRKDMLFATGKGDERTWWTCLEWEPESHHVRYFRLTPGNRAAFVEVHCRARGSGSTDVMVSYDMQPLGRAGERYIDQMDDAAFAGMIGEWPDLIEKSNPATA